MTEINNFQKENYVIDASVVIKWFSKDREKHREESLKIIRLIKEEEITVFAPKFLLFTNRGY